ncbi:MAG: cyclase family protein, partial [Terriglobales bacterium]
MLKSSPRIIDISIPVSSRSACFPGDTPFSRQITVTCESSGVINLTALTMSPHVGTHTDSPVHVRGNLALGRETAGEMPLEPFLGEALVIDIAEHTGPILQEQIEKAVSNTVPLPPRILFRTCNKIRYEVFEDDYPHFTPQLVDYLAERKVMLMGIDTPSVDHIRAKSLDVHHQL